MVRPRLIAVLLAAVLLAAGGGWLARGRSGDAAPGGDERVVRVVDGDTVVLGHGGRARLIGIDTPEVHGQEECFGRRAAAFTERRLAGRRVGVEIGVESRDRYGRLLVYLTVDGRLFNADLVRDGYATPLAIAPNVRYAQRFARLAAQAKRARRGLWSACAS
jgi:endonuclease YncB( thermonuclease family)